MRETYLKKYKRNEMLLDARYNLNFYQLMSFA